MKWNTVMAAMLAMAPAATHSQQAPHSGQESRAIKALSANEVQQHLEILTPTQVRRYDVLRGYSGEQQGQDGAAAHGKRHQ